MAARNWVTSICTAIGVAAGAGAAQLGVGYGLSVIAWVPAVDDSSRSLWLASLAWVAWLAANSTAVGALVADRLSQRGAPPAGSTKPIDVVWSGVIALAAAIGALVTVPLVAVPARFAQQANNSAPQFTAGGYAVVGVVIGLVIAVGALNVRAIAANVLASAGWLWLLAVGAVVHGLRSGAGVGTAQLATWQFTGSRWVRGMVNLPSALLMLGVALLIGVAAAWPAGRRGDHRVGVALSGLVGPLLVAAAYFLAVPGIDGGDQQLSAYVTAPYAVIAGLAGSVLVSAIGSRGARAKARLAREEKDAEEHAAWQRAMGSDEPPPAPKKSTRGRRKDTTAGDAEAAAGGTAGTATGRVTRASKTAAAKAAAAGDPAGGDQTPTAAGRSAVKATGTASATGTPGGASGAAGSPSGAGGTSGGTGTAAAAAGGASGTATGTGTGTGTDAAGRRQRGQEQGRSSRSEPDLDEDAYAPARAYVTDTADDDEPPKAAGRPGVSRPPLWPDPSRSSKRRKGR